MKKRELEEQLDIALRALAHALSHACQTVAEARASLIAVGRDDWRAKSELVAAKRARANIVRKVQWLRATHRRAVRSIAAQDLRETFAIWRRMKRERKEAG